jgi:EAL domain-containing protein (putative c-di-GMP-specific phosphodiesterase class I)
MLKIDRSFIAALGNEDDSQPIIAAIINMALGLKIDVVAEGIETPAQADTVRGLGCRRAQGYFYAQPLPAGAIAALLDSTLPVPGSLALPPARRPQAVGRNAA